MRVVILAVLWLSICWNIQAKVVNYSKSYTIIPGVKTTKAKLSFLLPQDYERWQKILEESFSHRPTRIFTDGDNRYAEYIFHNLNKNIVIRYDADIDIQRYDLSKAKGKKINFKLNNYSKYLKQERYMEKNDLAFNK